MDIVAVGFWTFLVSATSILAVFGCDQARKVAIACLTATFCTFGVNFILGFAGAQLAMVMIDAVLLIYVLRTALTSHAHWPLWFCGFHLVTVASEIAKITIPAETPLIYTNFAGFWALPALGAAAIGVILDRRVVEQNR